MTDYGQDDAEKSERKCPKIVVIPFEASSNKTKNSIESPESLGNYLSPGYGIIKSIKSNPHTIKYNQVSTENAVNTLRGSMALLSTKLGHAEERKRFSTEDFSHQDESVLLKLQKSATKNKLCTCACVVM
ncbi:hypothetical protein SteCoe_10512 [Stentor coeruleus]|uniref:Uncharacterized protein n=1 Tax=Stentor coeruleus TaxID=5963 RepID=A0A1R2CFM9_9CILI|nr:hypothetical protein SteCoe_10512 [Stentor coeruleus]